MLSKSPVARPASSTAPTGASTQGRSGRPDQFSLVNFLEFDIRTVNKYLEYFIPFQ
jgi:hypothetical protein